MLYTSIKRLTQIQWVSVSVACSPSAPSSHNNFSHSPLRMNSWHCNQCQSLIHLKSPRTLYHHHHFSLAFHLQPIILSKSRLGKYFDTADLPVCLSGTIAYEHDRWINNHIVSATRTNPTIDRSTTVVAFERNPPLVHSITDQSIDFMSPLQRFEEFKRLHERATNDLENLHLLLLDNKSVRADQTEQALRTCARLNGDVKLSLDATLTNGKSIKCGAWMAGQRIRRRNTLQRKLCKNDQHPVAAQFPFHFSLITMLPFVWTHLQSSQCVCRCLGNSRIVCASS